MCAIIKTLSVGIDAPELHQAYGPEARKYLSQLTFEKDVIVKWKEYDRCGRILGAVYLDGLLINQQMIVDGFAWHFKKYSITESFANAELAARKAQRGLWAEVNAIAPWDFRLSEKEKEEAALLEAKEAQKSLGLHKLIEKIEYEPPVPAPVMNDDEASERSIYVHGYYRKNGTYVRPYLRAASHK